MRSKKIELYEDITTNKLHTFNEVKCMYAEANESDLPIDDATMYLIIMENLFQNGGNIKLINPREDDILAWCIDYADYNEAERHLSKEETEISIRDIYTYISYNEKSFLDEIISLLRREKDSDSAELLCRLENLLGKDGVD